MLSDGGDNYSEDFESDGINKDPTVAIRSKVETVYMIGMSTQLHCLIFMCRIPSLED